MDIHVPESSYARLARLLKTAGLPFNIAIADVKAAVTRERRAHSEKAPSWYSHYHPLDEVSSWYSHYHPLDEVSAAAWTIGCSSTLTPKFKKYILPTPKGKMCKRCSKNWL